MSLIVHFKHYLVITQSGDAESSGIQSAVVDKGSGCNEFGFVDIFSGYLANRREVLLRDQVSRKNRNEAIGNVNGEAGGEGDRLDFWALA